MCILGWIHVFFPIICMRTKNASVVYLRFPNRICSSRLIVSDIILSFLLRIYFLHILWKFSLASWLLNSYCLFCPYFYAKKCSSPVSIHLGFCFIPTVCWKSLAFLNLVISHHTFISSALMLFSPGGCLFFTSFG